MEDEEFQQWLAGLRTQARRNARPIDYYQTRFGPAQLERDVHDPSQAFFRGDDFYVSMDDDPDAYPVRGLPAAQLRERARENDTGNFRIPERARRSLGERFMFDAWEAQSYGSGVVTPFPHPTPGRRAVAGVASLNRTADRAMQAQMSAEDSFMRYWEDGDVGAGILHGGAALTGTLAGALTDPLNFIMPGETMAARVGGQAAFAALLNTGEQASGDSRDRYSVEESVRLGMELDRIYREEGDEGLREALGALEAAPPSETDLGFDWLEFAFATGGSAALQVGFEGVGHGFGRLNSTPDLRVWRAARKAAEEESPEALRGFELQHPTPPGRIQQILTGFQTPFVRAAARQRIRSLGDPELDALARTEDGGIDPRAIPVEEAFAATSPWLRQMAPVVERAATATSGEQRALAYSEAALRMTEAMSRGDDPLDFINTMVTARFTGELPNLKAFDALESIARQVRDGDLILDQLDATANHLARLTERLDPAIAGLRQRRRTFRQALRQADDDLNMVRAAEAEARPAVEVGVGDAHFPGKRLITEDERLDIDALAVQASERRAARKGLSLAAWAVKRGGVLDDGGDLAAAVGGVRARPGLLSGRGRAVDDLARAAHEAGYFPDLGREPTAREFIDALGEEVNGRAALYPLADADELHLDAQQRSAESWLERHGIDPNQTDIEALKREIADKIYDATYADEVDAADADLNAGGGGTRQEPQQSAAETSTGTDGNKAAGRPAPAGWGRGRGPGGGGAMTSPLQRVEASITPIHRQTVFRRSARDAKRRGVSTYVSDVIARAYTSIFEAQHPLVKQQRDLVGEIERAAGAPLALAPSDNAALLARISRDSYSAGHLDLIDGVRPYRQPRTKASPSFREAIEMATGGKEWTPERVTRFEAYLVSRRGVKAWARYAAGELPRPPHAMSALDLSDAIRQAEADSPEFTAAADLLYRFLAAHWQKKRDAGLISDEQFQAGLKNNEDYVPFQRDMDDSGADPSRGGETPDGAPSTGGGRTNKRKAFQRFRGSDRKILSPLSTIMADVYATSDRIARNEAYRAFVDLSVKAGPAGEMIAKRIPRPMRKTHIDIVEEAERAVRASGGTQADAKALGGQLDALLNGDTSRVIYRPGEDVGGQKIIYVWRDGEREAWELTDPEWADDLFKAMTGLTQESRDLFVDIIAVPTQMIRTAITAWPGFVGANIMRDSLSAWMVTDLGYKPGEALVGAAQVLRQGDLAKLYNAVGTQGGGIVRGALPRSKLQRDLPALRGKTLRMRNLDPREGAAQLWRAFETATELSENASRIQLFARGFERAKKEGMSDYDAALWAGYESRDYLDFQRSGSKMLNFRRVALFLNAALQGLDRTVRTMGAEDGRTLLKPLINMMQGRTPMDRMTPDQRYQVGRAYKYWVKLALVGTFGLMLRALWASNEDSNEAYEYGYSDYIKNNYWLIELGRYSLAIPKPFEHAVLSNIFERSYEAQALNDPAAWDRLVVGLGETYLPPTEVTAANIPIQLYANRTKTGAPIVPEGLEDLDPHLQFTATTSQVSVDMAQGLSEHAGIEVSPAQLDHVFGGVGGEFFRAPARSLDGDAPAMNAVDFPVLNRFLREPGRGGTPQRVAFNDSVMRNSGALNRAAGTLREIRDRGDVALAQRFLEEREPFERTFAVLQVGFETEARRLHPMNRAKAVVTEIGRVRRELNGSRALASETLFLPDLTPRERRDALEALDDVSSAEMQAALVMAGAPEFEGRRMMDVEARYARLETLAPAVAALLRARLLTGDNKAVEFETMRRTWPEAQRRIERDGFRADLTDLAAMAEADFGLGTMRALELESRGGRMRSTRERDRERESFEEEAQP